MTKKIDIARCSGELAVKGFPEWLETVAHLVWVALHSNVRPTLVADTGNLHIPRDMRRPPPARKTVRPRKNTLLPQTRIEQFGTAAPRSEIEDRTHHVLA